MPSFFIRLSLLLSLAGLAACQPLAPPAAPPTSIIVTAMSADTPAAAATTTPSAAAPITSGLRGHVTLGPTCPVARIDSPCPDKPYQASLTILDQSQRQIAQVQTDPHGDFLIQLPPGVYIVRPETPGRFPHALEQAVTVAAGQFTTITITFDSGIR